MGLAENILVNEKVMDNLARIYADTLNASYGNGKSGNDAMAKKDMIYFLEQNCGVCQTPSSIAAQLTKIWGKIQEAARKYGYRGPIMQPKSEELSYHLQDIADKILADEKFMMILGQHCYMAANDKHLVKGAMMSDRYYASYPNVIVDMAKYKHLGYVSFREAKEIAKYLKKDIMKYAKLYAKEEEAKKAAGEMNEGIDELSPKLLQKAADKAWDMSRYKQAKSFEGEAAKRASEEFQGDSCIRRITPKSIAYVLPDGSAGLICNDGSYAYRPSSGYNNERGWLRGMTRFPKYMKVPDKRTARSICRWWKIYYAGEKDVPFMDDWHEIAEL